MFGWIKGLRSYRYPAWQIHRNQLLPGLDMVIAVLKDKGLQPMAMISYFLTPSTDLSDALMKHPLDLDGLVYLGRRCGVPYLAMFGGANSPRPYQKDLEIISLELSCWDQFWPMLDRLGARVSSMPKSPKRRRCGSL